MGRSASNRKTSPTAPPSRQIILGSQFEIQKDLPAQKKDLEAMFLNATANDLPRLWNRIVKKPAWRNIPVSEDLRDDWINRFMHRQKQGLPPLFPGTYITMPSGHTSQDQAILDALEHFRSSDPEAFDRFFSEEILPGIRGEVPPLLRSRANYGLFLSDVLKEKFPECSGALLAIENDKIFDKGEIPRHVFFWKTLAAIQDGMNPTEASIYAARTAIRGRLRDSSVLRRMQNKLEQDSQRFRELGLSPTVCSEIDLWERLEAVFDDTHQDSWAELARGEISLDEMFLDFIENPF